MFKLFLVVCLLAVSHAGLISPSFLVLQGQPITTNIVRGGPIGLGSYGVGPFGVGTLGLGGVGYGQVGYGQVGYGQVGVGQVGSGPVGLGGLVG